MTRLIATKYLLSVFLLIPALMVGIIAMGKPAPQHGFAFDFPKYIGGTLASMIEDIGYTPESYDAMYSDINGQVSYTGYHLYYSQGVQIEAVFDSLIYQPAGQDEIIHDLDYFKDKTIGGLEILFTCPSDDKK
jgi:hypothetical protein